MNPYSREPEPTTLDAVLQRAQSSLLEHLEKTYSDPNSREADWSPFLNHYPDALTAFYGEPIAYLDREKYIDDDGRDRVDILVKRELSYQFDVLELKAAHAAVLDTNGRLTTAARNALSQVMRYARTLRRLRTRRRLAIRGFEVTVGTRVDILGFTNRDNPAIDIGQAIRRWALSSCSDAQIPRLMTWDDLRSELKAHAPVLFTARLEVRRWIRRALRKAAHAADAASAWRSVSDQIGRQGAFLDQLSDWRYWVLQAFDLVPSRVDLLADLCAVLTYEVKGDILADGDWQHRTTYRCGDALALIQENSHSGTREQQRRAKVVLLQAAKAIALGIDGANAEECLWFAHLARRMSTNLLQQRDVFTLLRKRRQELITAGDRERLWVATNLGYLEAMHDATNVKELFDFVKGRYDRELLRHFNLQHAKSDPEALASNIAKKVQDPSSMETRVAPWDKFVKDILTTTAVTFRNPR